MYRLYHYPLCPSSRAIRIAMAEKNVPFTLIAENFWEKRENFMRINKSGSVPFLAKKEYDENGNPKHLLLSGPNAILEYLEEKYTNFELTIGTIEQRAEIRRICDWFSYKFQNEVMQYILTEKVFNFFKTKDVPDTYLLGIANHNLNVHLDYFGYLIGQHGWIAGKRMTMADIVAASNISVLDYLGMINWQRMSEDNNKSNLKEWYSIIKSRPSFRLILQDSVVGFNPPHYYRELDF